MLTISPVVPGHQMSDRALKTIPRSTLRGQLVSKVLNAIFSGELKGGDRLIEEELAMKLGVSRTPKRTKRWASSRPSV